MFIHEANSLTAFKLRPDIIDHLKVMHRIGGYLAGRMAAIGFNNQLAATVEAVTNSMVESSEI